MGEILVNLEGHIRDDIDKKSVFLIEKNWKITIREICKFRHQWENTIFRNPNHKEQFPFVQDTRTKHEQPKKFGIHRTNALVLGRMFKFIALPSRKGDLEDYFILKSWNFLHQSQRAFTKCTTRRSRMCVFSFSKSLMLISWRDEIPTPPYHYDAVILDDGTMSINRWFRKRMSKRSRTTSKSSSKWRLKTPSPDWT